jgi:hypothetical protein
MIKKRGTYFINIKHVIKQALRIATQTKCTTITEFETLSIAICGDTRCVLPSRDSRPLQDITKNKFKTNIRQKWGGSHIIIGIISARMWYGKN